MEKVTQVKSVLSDICRLTQSARTDINNAISCLQGGVPTDRIIELLKAAIATLNTIST